MYPGVPLRTVNGRFALRSEEIPAGFWCGLHPEDHKRRIIVSSRLSNIVFLLPYTLFVHHQHIPNNAYNNSPYFNGNSGL